MLITLAGVLQRLYLSYCLGTVKHKPVLWVSWVLAH